MSKKRPAGHAELDSPERSRDGEEALPSPKSTAAGETPKARLINLAVKHILDGEELDLEEMAEFIQGVEGAVKRLKEHLVQKAESEIAHREAIRAKVLGVEPGKMFRDEPAPAAPDYEHDVDGYLIVRENAEKIVELVRTQRLEGLRRKDVVSALHMSDAHASQGLAYAVREGWLKLEGQTRGAKYFLP